jgi:hypothetical protein
MEDSVKAYMRQIGAKGNEAIMTLERRSEAGRSSKLEAEKLLEEYRKASEQA